MAEERLLSLTAPGFSDKDLVLQSFAGRESLSRLFHFQLSFLADNHEIKASQLVGKQVTVTLLRGNNPARYYNGYISRLSAGETVRFVKDGKTLAYRVYRAEMVPWLWLLTKRARCFIYHIEKTDDPKPLQDILKKVLTDAGFSSNYSDSGIKRKREIDYCVQYRETDFNFISRLLEQYGVYYYFEHTKTDHKLILADSTSGYGDCPESKVDMPATTGQTQVDHVTSWQHDYQFVSGKWSHTDYNFKDPSTDYLKTTATGVDLQGLDKYEIYDYPGEYDKPDVGEKEVKIRMEEEEAAYNQIVGSSLCKTFSPGLRFELAGHEVGSENAKYVLASVEHSVRDGGIPGASTGSSYSNSFVCLPESVTYRPPRITPKPVISGVQTAVVVGKKGEEIDTDEHGRVKVLFHWDREGRKKEDQTCSCWIRVSQHSAGKKWGSMSIPRIGQEVVVEFLEGDPDRPLITGCLYNAQQKPGYDLPAEKTKTYFKSNSTKDDSGFNELMFEDKKDDERIFIHAQKNMDVRVLNDHKERVIGNSHAIVGNEKDGKKGGDFNEMIYQDHNLNVKRHQVTHIEGNHTMLVGAGEAEDGGNVAYVVEKQIAVAIGQQGLSLQVQGDMKQGVDGSQSLTVAGDLKEKVGSLSLTCTGDHNEKTGNHSMSVDQQQNIKVGMNAAWEAGMAIHVKSGMTLILEAGVQLSLKVGGSFIDINPVGVFISGPLVNINSGGAAGAGAGCKPQDPQTPDEPNKNVDKAKPTEPEKAHDSKGGTKSCK